MAKIEADIPFPACGIVARQDSDTTADRALKRAAPIEPGPRQCRSRTANSGPCQAHLLNEEHQAIFVVVLNEVALVLVFDDPWVRLASRKTSDVTFGSRHRHPGRFGGVISPFYDHSRRTVSYLLPRDCRRYELRDEPAVSGRQGPHPENSVAARRGTAARIQGASLSGNRRARIRGPKADVQRSQYAASQKDAKST
jgi:hypothetical protein